MHNLTGGTTYYFAIKVIDEWPNASAISNVRQRHDACGRHRGPDRHHRPARRRHAVQRWRHLAWTAPADVGSAGLAGYDVRYSTSPIDAGNWASATQAPNDAGRGRPRHHRQQCSVRRPGRATRPTTSRSRASTGPSRPTSRPCPTSSAARRRRRSLPVTVHNPWITNDRVADTRNLATHGRHLRQRLHARRRGRPSPTDIQDQRDQRLQQLQAPRVPLGR